MTLKKSNVNVVSSSFGRDERACAEFHFDAYVTIVITGFNTDIEHEGVVYHVQTEDKGLETPLILSLVYSGGAILASKRARYEDLIASGFSDEALSERLTRQHTLICAAVHAGRIEDLKRMSAPHTAEGIQPPAAGKEQPEPQLEILRGDDERRALEEERLAFAAERERLAQLAAERERLAQEVEKKALEARDQESLDLEEQVNMLPLREILPPPPALPADLAAYSVHDQRRQSTLGDFPIGEGGLRITILGQQEFHSGETPTLKVMVGFRTGSQEQPIAKAAVSVKVLGTTFRPQLYSAKTQSDGVAAIPTQIPKFTSGRAAILIRAVAGGKETELRRVILPG